MGDTTITVIIVLIWLIGMVVFLKDYVTGARRVSRKRKAPSLSPQRWEEE